ncbi:hypothetical protein [Burkholderia vietnamiensis]|uniref:hypothetical protein n=1 Tax=Burkholderia vietnamiensis TaxID=60552 RepID=UPI001BAA71B9|nr:hypothetical protein [Burkholderia vietnamiensis]
MKTLNVTDPSAFRMQIAALQGAGATDVALSGSVFLWDEAIPRMFENRGRKIW